MSLSLLFNIYAAASPMQTYTRAMCTARDELIERYTRQLEEAEKNDASEEELNNIKYILECSLRMKKRVERYEKLAAEKEREQLAAEEQRENERQMSHLLHILQEEHKKRRACEKPYGLWFI